MEGGSEREKKRAKPGSSRTRLSFMARQMVLCPPPKKGGQKVTKIAEFTILFCRSEWRRTLTRYTDWAQIAEGGFAWFLSPDKTAFSWLSHILKSQFSNVIAPEYSVEQPTS
jgi:hypothetical protein